MASRPSRNLSILFVFIALICFIPLWVGAYMPSATATTTTVAASSTTIALGDTVTFTATVTTSTGTPTGLVTFFDGNTPLGSGALQVVAGNNQATFATSLLSAIASPHSITAIYQGDGTHTASTSSAISETVNSRSSATAVVMNPATVVVGQPSTATVTLTDSGSVPPGTADVFSATGAPATGRSGFTATFFADGLVLVAGGTDVNNNVLQSAEIYSFSGTTFAATGNLNTARTGAVAVLLPNGKVLVAGGSSDGTANGALNTAELFDPSAGTFTLAGAGSSNQMKAARFGATATLLNNGKVLLAGGENSGSALNSAELYDPSADTFTATGELNTARTGHSATLLGNDQVLVAGGSSDGTANGALNNAELFDPAGNSGAGTFTSVTGVNSTLSVGRWRPEAALLLSGKVLIAGGQNSGGALASADLYDPVGSTFSPADNSMAQAHANGSATTLPTGQVMVVSGGGSITVADFYDPGTNRFDFDSRLINPELNATATLLDNGDVLVVGLASGITPQSDAELFAPSFNPQGTVSLTSSEATDVFGATCTLIPTVGTASTCTSTVTPANVATSPHTITGTYPADAVHSGSSNSAPLTVSKADTITTITSNTPNPSAVNQPVNIAVSVTAKPPGSGTPTGNVTVSDGVGQMCTTGALDNTGAGNCSLTPTAAGTDTLTASYNGDANFNTSTSAGVSQTIVAAPSISKAFNPTSIPLNGTSTLTFTITNPAGNTVALAGVAVTDTLPTGLTVSSNSTTVCGGTLTTTAPTGIALSGATIGVGGQCQFSVTVTGAAAGSFTNTTGNVTATNAGGVAGNTASATLTVVAPPSIAKAFNPNSVPLNGTSTLTFTITNPAANTVPEAGVAFSDTLPTGLVVATPNGLTNSCSGTAAATAGGTNITLMGGGIAVNSSCTVVVNVTGTAAGAFTNISGSVSSTNGGTGNTATDTLTVVAPPSISKAFAPGTVVVNQNTTLTFTITNPAANTVPEAGVAFSDTLPTGLVVATPNGLNNTCGGNAAATAAGTSISLTGGTIAVNNSCTLAVSVIGTVSGSYSNTSGPVSSTNGGTGNTASATLTVNTRHTTTTVALNPSTVVVNQQTTATLTVTDDDPNGGKISPTGTVSVTSDSGGSSPTDTIVGSPCTLVAGTPGVSSCQVIITPNGKGSGTHAITASYSGSSIHTASTGSAMLPVTTRHTTTTVALNPSTVVVNQQTTATLTVTDDDPNGGKISPTGTVSVTSDFGGSSPTDTIGGSPCTLAPGTPGVSSCQVTITPNGKNSGAHTITASYAGSNIHTASTGSAILTVNTRHTTTTVALSLSTVVVNQQTTATMTVTDDDPNGGKISPAGTVSLSSDSGGSTFTDVIGGSPCTLVPTLTTGVSTCQVTLTPKGKGGVTGAHNLTVDYSGSNVHSASSGSSLLTVNTRHTSTKVASSINPVKIATLVNLTVTVTDDDPNGSPLPPAGTINISSSEGTDLPSSATCTLSGSSAATTCSITLTAQHVAGGSHTISAGFTQDQQHSASSTVPANSVLAVQPADTATAIASTASLTNFLQTFLGQQVSFTAAVTNTDNGSVAAPVGSVQFLVDGNAIGTVALASNGTTSSIATFTATLAQVGLAQSSNVSHSVTIKFQPNADFVTSTSADSISMTMVPTINNIPGQTISPVTLGINGVGTSGPVTFKCTVQLLGSAIPSAQQANFPLCTLNPTSTTLPNTVTVSLTTVATSTADLVNPEPSFRASSLAGFYALSTPLAIVLGLLVLGDSRRRKNSPHSRLFRLLVMVLVLSLLWFAVSCGGGFNNSGNLQPLGNGTQQGTYVVTVIGTDSNNNIVVISTIPLNVQP